jgi:cyclohexadieny/prephenate dehydrogenase
LQRAVRWGDGETLFNLFSRARDARRKIIAAGQDTAAPDFGRSTKKD